MPKSSETYGNFGKSSEISVNFRKLRKRFKPGSGELKRFMKLLENFGNSFKSVLEMFLLLFKNFRKIFGNLWKCSEIFRNLWKTSETDQKYFFSVFEL